MRWVWKPCPFCGSTNVEVNYYFNMWHFRRPWRCECKDCGANGPRQALHQNCIYYWQQRKDVDSDKCPCCSGDYKHTRTWFGMNKITCVECDMSTASFFTKKKALLAWLNRKKGVGMWDFLDTP